MSSSTGRLAYFILKQACTALGSLPAPHEGIEYQNVWRVSRLSHDKAQLPGRTVALLNEITIGETCFFRNQSQLQALCNAVIPRIVQVKAKLAVRRMRIWSAGCSTGEEPYTLAMLLLESQRSLKDWIVEILATDLNESSLAHARMRFMTPAALGI